MPPVAGSKNREALKGRTGRIQVFESVYTEHKTCPIITIDTSYPIPRSEKGPTFFCHKILHNSIKSSTFATALKKIKCNGLVAQLVRATDS